jgi:hypothetical protein
VPYLDVSAGYDQSKLVLNVVNRNRYHLSFVIAFPARFRQ